MIAATPVVSVLIPCYNAARYIRAALDSLVGQSMQSWEAIVVDDASTDASRDIVASFSDSRVRLLANSRNSGPSASRNRALAAARGYWVAVLDADDEFKPGRLDALVSAAEIGSADAVIDNLEVFEDGSQRVTGDWFSQYGVPVTEVRVVDPLFFVKHEIGVAKALIRREFLTRHGIEYDRETKYGEDFLLYFQLLQARARFIAVPDALYRLRRGETNSLTTNHLLLVERVIQLNQRVLNTVDAQHEPALKSALERRLAELEVLRRYHHVISPLRRRQFGAAASAVVSDPGAIFCVVQQITRRARQRFI